MQATKFVFIFCTSLYLVCTTGTVMAGIMSKFKLEDFRLCEEVAEQKLTFFINPKDFNSGLQLVDINMSLPVPIGNDAMAKVLFEVDTGLTTKHAWTHLFDMEGESCKMLDRYVGQLWYDMERAMGIMPHSCPLPRGSYHAVNFLVDYQTLKLQTFPFGKIRVTISVSLKSRPEIQGCVKIILSNTA